jgi:glycosyltransferase involved in cell wall biosynthesis
VNKYQYKFSIIIPSYNRRDILSRVLVALQAQSLPTALFQVIVFDDRSTDGTWDFLKKFKRQTGLSLTCLRGHAGNAGAARNLCLDVAEGERVLFLDSDTIPQKDLLAQHLAWHEHFGDRTCVVGNVTMSYELENKGQIRRHETRTKYDSQHLAEIPWQEYRAANSSIARLLCRSAGGFDPELQAAEDTEFASRLDKLGIRFIFVRDIQAVHFHPMNSNAYLRKGRLYGQAVAHWYLKSPELRPLLVTRYGVYARQLSYKRKLKHLVRRLFINFLTVPLLFHCAGFIRAVWCSLSDAMFKSLFRYHVRLSFRKKLKNAIRETF